METLLLDHTHRMDDTELRISGEDEFVTESDCDNLNLLESESKILVDDGETIDETTDNEISYEEMRPLNPHARYVQYSKGSTESPYSVVKIPLQQHFSSKNSLMMTNHSGVEDRCLPYKKNNDMKDHTLPNSLYPNTVLSCTTTPSPILQNNKDDDEGMGGNEDHYYYHHHKHPLSSIPSSSNSPPPSHDYPYIPSTATSHPPSQYYGDSTVDPSTTDGTRTLPFDPTSSGSSKTVTHTNNMYPHSPLSSSSSAIRYPHPMEEYDDNNEDTLSPHQDIPGYEENNNNTMTTMTVPNNNNYNGEFNEEGEQQQQQLLFPVLLSVPNSPSHYFSSTENSPTYPHHPHNYPPNHTHQKHSSHYNNRFPPSPPSLRSSTGYYTHNNQPTIPCPLPSLPKPNTTTEYASTIHTSSIINNDRNINGSDNKKFGLGALSGAVWNQRSNLSTVPQSLSLVPPPPPVSPPSSSHYDHEDHEDGYPHHHTLIPVTIVPHDPTTTSSQHTHPRSQKLISSPLASSSSSSSKVGTPFITRITNQLGNSITSTSTAAVPTNLSASTNHQHTLNTNNSTDEHTTEKDITNSLVPSLATMHIIESVAYPPLSLSNIPSSTSTGYPSSSIPSTLSIPVVTLSPTLKSNNNSNSNNSNNTPNFFRSPQHGAVSPSSSTAYRYGSSSNNNNNTSNSINVSTTNSSTSGIGSPMYRFSSAVGEPVRAFAMPGHPGLEQHQSNTNSYNPYTATSPSNTNHHLRRSNNGTPTLTHPYNYSSSSQPSLSTSPGHPYTSLTPVSQRTASVSPGINSLFPHSARGTPSPALPISTNGNGNPYHGSSSLVYNNNNNNSLSGSSSSSSSSSSIIHNSQQLNTSHHQSHYSNRSVSPASSIGGFSTSSFVSSNSSLGFGTSNGATNHRPDPPGPESTYNNNGFSSSPISPVAVSSRNSSPPNAVSVPAQYNIQSWNGSNHSTNFITNGPGIGSSSNHTDNNYNGRLIQGEQLNLHSFHAPSGSFTLQGTAIQQYNNVASVTNTGSSRRYVPSPVPITARAPQDAIVTTAVPAVPPMVPTVHTLTNSSTVNGTTENIYTTNTVSLSPSSTVSSPTSRYQYGASAISANIGSRRQGIFSYATTSNSSSGSTGATNGTSPTNANGRISSVAFTTAGKTVTNTVSPPNTNGSIHRPTNTNTTSSGSSNTTAFLSKTMLPSSNNYNNNSFGRYNPKVSSTTPTTTASSPEESSAFQVLRGFHSKPFIPSQVNDSVSISQNYEYSDSNNNNYTYYSGNDNNEENGNNSNPYIMDEENDE